MILIMACSVTLLVGCGPKKPPAPEMVVTPEVRQIGELARAATSDTERTNIAVRGTTQARTVNDFIYLNRATYYYARAQRDSIIMQGTAIALTADEFAALAAETDYYSETRGTIVSVGASRMSSPTDIVRLVKMVNGDSLRDKILLENSKRFSEPGDLKILADAAYYYGNAKNQILSRAASNVDSPSSGGSGTVGGVDVTPPVQPNIPDQDLRSAYQALVAAQNAYTDAIGRNAPSEEIQKLGKRVNILRQTYELLLKNQ